MALPEFLLFRAHEKFDKEGKLTDNSTRNFMEKYLYSFTDWIKLFQ